MYNSTVDLRPFKNGEFELHLQGANGELRALAPDLARGLAFKDAYDMLRTLPARHKGTELVRTPGGEQTVSYVTEGGFYRLIGQRQTARIKDRTVRDSVERFQSWVFDEVLPAIRRNGWYHPNAATVFTWEEMTAVVFQEHEVTIEVPELRRVLCAAGVLRVSGAPKTKFRPYFWFTGSAWTVRSQCAQEIAGRVVAVRRALVAPERPALATPTQLELDLCGGGR